MEGPGSGPLAAWVQLVHVLGCTPGLPVAAAMAQATPWARLCASCSGAPALVLTQEQ